MAPVLVAVLLLDLCGLALRWSSPAESGAAKVDATAVPTEPSAPAVEAAAAPDPSGPAAVAGQGERAIEPAPDSFDGPLPPGAGRVCSALPGPSGPVRAGDGAPPPSGGTWAVIVGINDYPGSGHDLATSTNDARDMDLALARYGVPADHRLMVLDGEASGCGIESALQWLVERAGPDATAVFFYSGHGRKLSDGSRTLVAADGQLVTDRQLGSRLSGLKAARTWIALVTCYGGGFIQVLGPNRILTAAADGNSLAYENLGFGRSYLAEYMVRRAMLENSAPSVEAAYAAAHVAIAAAHPGRLPVQFDQAPGDLALGPAPAARPGPPAVAAAPGPRGAPAPAPARPPVVTTTTRPCKPVLLILCS